MSIFTLWEYKTMLKKSLFTAILFCIYMYSVQAEIQLEFGQPPGKILEVDGRMLHLNCYGEGRPTVILDAGLGGFSLDWLQVQDLLRNKFQVCAYDRAGYGWSQIGPSPRITEQIVDELYALLEVAELEPPFILVGHSFGGFNVQYFSKLYPSLVAGMVLVESSHPQQFARLPDLPVRKKQRDSSQRLTTMFDASVLRLYPESHRLLVGNHLASYKFIRTQQREFMNFTQSAVQVDQVSRRLQIPLAVVTRGRRVWSDTPYGLEQERIWMEMQQELLSLTDDSWQVIADESQHLVHLQQPELVAETIEAVINRVCSDYPVYQAAIEGEIMMCMR